MPYLHTEILSYWHTDRCNFIGPFLHKDRGPKDRLNYTSTQSVILYGKETWPVKEEYVIGKKICKDD